MNDFADLLVTHETTYLYSARVESAHHLAHLQPLDDPRQTVLDYALQVEPAPRAVSGTRDPFGNAAHHFSVHELHETLRVIARSHVRVTAAPPVEIGPAWEVVREGFVYRARAGFIPAVEFSFGSRFAPVDRCLSEYAALSFAPGRPLADACEEFMQRIHADFAYAPASTDVSTGALQALALKRGVCQDFAHVMIGALRSIGLAARYVSGYLLTQPPAGHSRLIGADASHAWVEVWCPRNGWMAFDPTNGRRPGIDHVTLARGRDYNDVAPLRGVIRGGGNTHELRVAVSVIPAGEA